MKKVAAYTRQMADGRWRHITDQRLADGSRLGFSIDVTDLVHKSQALEQARAELQLAHERLEDAIEALPAGFELYDADDRLIMSNQVLRDMFPRVADLLARPGLTFDEIVRANVAAGSLAGVDAGNIEGWLTQRRAQRALPTNHTMVRAGAMWLRTIERRTRDGGLVGVRVDVTETVEQREAAEAARARLQDAIDALPDGFALYDREDRLVICNANYRDVYRDMAPGDHRRQHLRGHPALRPGARPVPPGQGARARMAARARCTSIATPARRCCRSCPAIAGCTSRNR